MKVPIFVYSTDDDYIDSIQAVIGELDYTIIPIKSKEELKKITNMFNPPAIILDAFSLQREVKNALTVFSKKFPSANYLLTFQDKLPFNLSEIKEWTTKTTCVQYPNELSLFIESLLVAAPITIPHEKIKIEFLFPVRITDLVPNGKFPFDMFYYMPKNKKVILYCRKNTGLGQNQIDRFKDNNIADLYILLTEKRAFSQYVTTKLKNLLKSGSGTLKREQAQKQVRDLFVGFFEPGPFDQQKGKQVLNTCREVVGKFITDVSARPDIYQQILQLAAHSSSSYNHALNVSTYATLFALAVGHNDIESLALAGLIHDIGLSTIPQEIANKQLSEMDDDERAIYKSHVVKAKELIEEKKFKVSEEVLRIILEHHENVDGSGYPKGLEGSQIGLESKICHIADELDYLTSAKHNIAPMTPLEALEHMMTKPFYDKELLEKIYYSLAHPNVTPIKQDKIKGLLTPINPNAKATNYEEDVKRRRRHNKPGAK
ncbi:MAG: HD domain-containing protein [Oligoflexia bacterium]|nr:HD domain-containing protein [Oligoflexia bacterium]